MATYLWSTLANSRVISSFDPNPRSITTTHVIFDNGSLLLVGDNTTGTLNDNAAVTVRLSARGITI